MDRNELMKLYNSAVNNLKNNEIPLDVFSEAMLETYEYLKSKQEKEDVYNPQAVPATEFLKELDVVYYRRTLEKKARKLNDTSKWVFLYNIDLYFSKIQEIPDSMRISLETGAQGEIQRGKGILLNGLNAGQDYKIYCYFKK